MVSRVRERGKRSNLNSYWWSVNTELLPRARFGLIIKLSRLGFIGIADQREPAEKRFGMIEVVIDSIRVSLTSSHRLVVLKDTHQDRYIPIWIDPFQAEAITIELQEGAPPPRPLTHDLIKSIIQELGGRVVHVLINDLRNDIYYARIVIEINGRQVEVDSRSSDAIAVAVRVKVPIFVADTVMERAAIVPDEDVEQEVLAGLDKLAEGSGEDAVDETRLSAFADFVNSLDLDVDEEEDDEL